MSFLSERGRAFRGVVAVNNWAVLHMERGNFGQAIESLQGGMKLMKFILEVGHDHRSEEGNATASVRHRRVDGDAVVADPQRWFVVPGNDVSQSQDSSLKTQVFSLVYSSSSSSSFESDPCASDTLPSHPSASHAFPIRIEESCCSGFGALHHHTNPLHEQETADLASAVLLYNLGLANLLEMSSQQESDGGSSVRTARHLNFARGLLEMSFHVMGSVASTNGNDGVSQLPRRGERGVDRTLSAESLPFALVLVHTMHRVLTELGQTDGATVAAADYGRILARHLDGCCGCGCGCSHDNNNRCWREVFFGGAAAAAA